VGASEVLVPDFFFGQTKQNAVYMLCSDGFRHQITPEEFYYSLEPNRMISPELMKQQELMLIDLNKQRDEHDNISVITIRTY
jgi:serine/threonine protein phosphatase PrpC